MNRLSCVSRASKLALAVLLSIACGPAAQAAVPDWLRSLAQAPLPSYKPETKAVVLLDEETTTVSESGEIHTVYRRAVKILRPNGRGEGTISVHYDSETKLTWLKGWSITASGQEYEVKEKEAIETNAVGDATYTDNRMKVLMIPGAEVGSVIGYEYQQRRRPFIFQDFWVFQEELPVRTSRYTLRLPRGWEYETIWNNHDKVEPTHGIEGESTWELKDVKEFDEEEYMPPRRAIAGRMVLHFFSSRPDLKGKQVASWSAVADWYANLTRDRRTATPEIKQQVASLTAGKSKLEQIEAIAGFVQRDVRYVAVEIGIGGFQPRFAGDVFRNRYGDCKDKVTLMSTMLREIGLESDYILVHTSRGVVRSDTPTSLTFNHVIMAIKLPADVPRERLHALYEHPKLGTLLMFDPTSEMTPVGDLPATLQKNLGLLLTSTGSEMIELPLLPPGINRLLRSAKLQLQPEGELTGQVEEVRTGSTATGARDRLLHAELSDRSKGIEWFLSSNVGNFALTKAEAGDLHLYERPLTLRYTFRAPEYAKKNGPLLLVRPRVLGHKTWSVMEGSKKRVYPVEFDSTQDDLDTFEIALPPGYAVDELPDPVDVAYDFGEYHSKVEQSTGKLKYTRRFVIKQVNVPTDRLEDLKKFYRQIAADERNMAVLKKTE